jgi:lipopolysaccharide/colanic/teichoic acid biosynthesis glycosyltransferase
VFYRQQRIGRDGLPFQMWKFRSMTVDADARRAELNALNPLDAANFKVVNDPRVTRVGRLIRRLSIDELPQLINVVRGEMTLVGPRPSSFALDDYELWQTERLDVRPGLTGPWQIAGRGTTLFPERCRIDIRYARSHNLRLNLRIIARTLPAALLGWGVT